MSKLIIKWKNDFSARKRESRVFPRDHEGKILFYIVWVFRLCDVVINAWTATLNEELFVSRRVRWQKAKSGDKLKNFRKKTNKLSKNIARGKWSRLLTKKLLTLLEMVVKERKKNIACYLQQATKCDKVFRLKLEAGCILTDAGEHTMRRLVSAEICRGGNRRHPRVTLVPIILKKKNVYCLCCSKFVIFGWWGGEMPEAWHIARDFSNFTLRMYQRVDLWSARFRLRIVVNLQLNVARRR